MKFHFDEFFIVSFFATKTVSVQNFIKFQFEAGNVYFCEDVRIRPEGPPGEKLQEIASHHGLNDKTDAPANSVTATSG